MQFNGTQFILGATIGVFSVGRLIASFFFGWMLDRDILPATRNLKNPKADCRPALSVSLVVVCIGHFMYIAASRVRILALVAISRTCTGFGTGVLAVARTVVSQWSSPADRVKYVSWIGIVQYFGFAVTPWIGAQSIAFSLFGPY